VVSPFFSDGTSTCVDVDVGRIPGGGEHLHAPHMTVVPSTGKGQMLEELLGLEDEDETHPAAGGAKRDPTTHAHAHNAGSDADGAWRKPSLSLSLTHTRTHTYTHTQTIITFQPDCAPHGARAV
jgi:hypothetical protein